MDNGIGIAKGVGLSAVVVLGTDDEVSGQWIVVSGQWPVVSEQFLVGKVGEVVAVGEVAMGPEFDLETDRILGQSAKVDVLPGAEQGVSSSDGMPKLTGWRHNTDMGLQGGHKTDTVGIGHLTGSGRSFGAVEG